MIADDEGVTRTFLAATLKSWGYDVQVARDGHDAWQQLSAEDGARLAILDWVMPGLDGPAVCRLVRELRDRYVYIVLLTSRSGSSDLVEGLEAGADDYIVKPFDVAELQARLRTGRRIVRLEEELRHRASHDSLTGLWSRGAILELLPREIERARRAGTTLAVMMADIDYFKRVNDTHGHVAGDAVLREVARRLPQSVRGYDLVGRYGGEEFLILLPKITEECALAVAERVRATVSAEPIAADGVSLTVTTSIGIATSGATTDRNGLALIQAADAALYRAKQLGRNRTELAR